MRHAQAHSVFHIAKSSLRFAVFVAATVVLSLAGATPALARQCTDSWTGGGGDGLWSDGANWSTGTEPGSSDSVCIQKSGVAVLMDVGDGIADVTVGSSDSLTLPNNSLIIFGSSIANSGQIILPAVGSNFYLGSGGTATLSGGGFIQMNSLNDQISGYGAGVRW
jgi:hypothetical protein